MAKLTLSDVRSAATWENARAIIVKCLFITIALFMSYMSYQWADQFKGGVSVVVFCAFIAFDIVLVPRFPMIVHYVNSIFATISSIVFMLLIGFMTIGSTIASKEDPTYNALLERIRSVDTRIQQIEAKKVPCIMMEDMQCMQDFEADNGPTLNKLQDKKDALLLEKQKYTKKKGGSFSDASVAPIVWLADIFDTTPERLNAYMLPALWLAILSIQSTLSAEAHNIKIHRPSLMRGVHVLLTMIFGVKHRYVENWRDGIDEMENGRKKVHDRRAA